jgi:hypothetical protein
MCPCLYSALFEQNVPFAEAFDEYPDPFASLGLTIWYSFLFLWPPQFSSAPYLLVIPETSWPILVPFVPVLLPAGLSLLILPPGAIRGLYGYVPGHADVDSDFPPSVDTISVLELLPLPNVRTTELVAAMKSSVDSTIGYLHDDVFVVVVVHDDDDVGFGIVV